MKNYLLLCGGVGGAKLALGFSKVLQPKISASPTAN